MYKITITYQMERGNTLAETVIDLPLELKRYTELKSMMKESEVYKIVQGVLERLVALQDYDRLVSWGYELTIEGDSDNG